MEIWNLMLVNMENTNTSLQATTQITAEEVNQLKKDFDQLKDDLNRAKKDVDKTNNFMYFVVLYVAVASIVAVLSIYWDGILSNKSDKELYLNYNEVYKNYSEKNDGLKDTVSQQKIEMNNLRNEFNILKAKNPYLK